MRFKVETSFGPEVVYSRSGPGFSRVLKYSHAGLTPSDWTIEYITSIRSLLAQLVVGFSDMLAFAVCKTRTFSRDIGPELEQ